MCKLVPWLPDWPVFLNIFLNLFLLLRKYFTKYFGKKQSDFVRLVGDSAKATGPAGYSAKQEWFINQNKDDYHNCCCRKMSSLLWKIVQIKRLHSVDKLPCLVEPLWKLASTTAVKSLQVTKSRLGTIWPLTSWNRTSRPGTRRSQKWIPMWSLWFSLWPLRSRNLSPNETCAR